MTKSFSEIFMKRVEEYGWLQTIAGLLESIITRSTLEDCLPLSSMPNKFYTVIMSPPESVVVDLVKEYENNNGLYTMPPINPDGSDLDKQWEEWKRRINKS